VVNNQTTDIASRPCRRSPPADTETIQTGKGKAAQQGGEQSSSIAGKMV